MKKRSKESIVHLGCTIHRHGSKYYRATIPRTYGLGRVRRVFKTIDAAKEWIEWNLTNIRTDVSQEPPAPSEIADFRKATALLPPGISILEAVRAGVRAITETPTLHRIATGQAVKKFMEEKTLARLRPKTIMDYSGKLALLPADRPLLSLTADDLAAAIGTTRADADWNNHVRVFHNFFAWSVTKGYLHRSTADALPSRRIDWTPPEIYTAAQIETVLRHAETHAPHLVPHIAIAAFAGIRTSGLARLPPTAVSVERGTILVPGPADKLRLGYLLTMPDNLRAWLSAYPYGPFIRSESQTSDLLKTLFENAGVPRLRNAFRHAFASHLLVLTNDAHRVASQLGHWHGEIDTLMEHYRRIVTPEEATAYFQIGPTLGHTSQTHQNS